MKDLSINKGEINFLIKPIVSVLLLLVFIPSLFLIGLGQVKSIVAKNNESKAIETKLNQKISILQNVPDAIAGDTTFLDVVMPSRSSVVYGISQIKAQAYKSNLLISDLRTGTISAEENGVAKATIAFEVEGDLQSIYAFLNSFSTALPLMTVEKIKLTKNDSVSKASATLAVYSTDLPKTIPSISSPATSLSNEEVKLLKNLATFTLPVFVEPKAEDMQTKEDPFN